MARARRLWYLLLPALFALALGLLYWGRRADTRSALTPNSEAVAPLRSAVTNANLVIVVIDAARADHLGCYGYPRETTPNIDRLASESFVFGNHFCQIPITAASTVSLFTSRFPDTHGVFYRAEPDSEPGFTLAAALDRAGFRTALFSSNPSASPAVGVGTDFREAHHRTLPVTQGRAFSPETLLLSFRTWLDDGEPSRFFAYLHFLPPHTPYHQPDHFTRLFADQTPPGFRPDAYHPDEFDFPIDAEPEPLEPPPFPDWINLYDANLRHADWAVGEIVNALTAAGMLEDTLLIVTSDHGEAFGEHGFIWHAHAIHDEAARIPLLIRFPSSPVHPRRIDCLTQTVDLLPTLCDLFSLPYPADEFQGRSLLPVLAGQADSAGTYAVTKSYRPEKYLIRDERHALLLYRNPEWRALYDMRADPRQTHNIIAERPDEAEALFEAFRTFAEAQRRPPACFLDPNAEPLPEPQPPSSDLSPGLRSDLEALGYLR
jgi:arylsulfatase A-like enzyme